MAKKEIIGSNSVQLAVAIGYEPFLVWSQKVPGGRIYCTAFSGEKLGHPCAEIGMEPRKRPLTKRVPEYPLDEFIAVVVGPQAVSMSDKERLPPKRAYHRRSVHGDTQFTGKVIKHPHVVVAGENMDGQPAVAELGQFSKKADIPPGDYMPVFEPKIEQVAYEKELGRIFPDSVQPTQNRPFPLPAAQTGIDAQMEIGGEIDFFTCFHGKRKD